MQLIKSLFKRDIKEFFTSFKKGDILSFLSSFFLLAIIYGSFVFVFNYLSEMYVGTNFGDLANGLNRTTELLTIGFSLVFIVNVIMGVKKVYSVLVSAKDNDVLIYQPVNTGSIFIYKLLKVYISQFISTLFVVLPFTIVVDLNSTFVGGVGYYFLVSLISILLPMISCSLAALVSVPFIPLIKKICSKFWLLLLMYVVIVIVFFWGYGYFLKTFSSLIRDGSIQYVFDLQTVNSIGKLTSWLYPSVFFTNMLVGKSLVLNILAVFVVSVLAMAIAYFIIKKIYTNIIQAQLEGESSSYHNKAKLKKRSPLATLLYKEYLIVLRTPTYAFQYFAMAITLPFMVYICATSLETTLQTLTFINCNYAIAIFSVFMLSILTNTFCATNISRDGKMFSMMKTMPLTINQIVKAKVIFCSLVSFVSVFASSLVLLVTGFINFLYFVIVFVLGFLFSLVQISYATRKDMKKPCFPSNEQDEITEGNSNMSTIILGGLFAAVVAAGGAMVLSVIIGLKYSELKAAYISIGFVFIITIISLLLSYYYLHRKIEDEYYMTEYK